MTPRELAAHALLELLDLGPATTFPFPDAKFAQALAVVDAVAAINGGGGE